MANKAQETTRAATDTAKETIGKGAETAQRASETASRGYEDLLILSRDNMEGMARASQAMLKGTSDLGSVWASFWNEQLTSGIEAMRSLTECHSWDEALNVQSEYTWARIRSTVSAEALGPRKARTGSPGRAWTSTKVTRLMPNSTGSS
jgi:hypothetical protein